MNFEKPVGVLFLLQSLTVISVFDGPMNEFVQEVFPDL